ncbi:hypothetical protein DM02DRAFT_539314, partial [Periconia macrospinosa]
APILDEINFSFREVTTNGSLNNDPWSVYRAEPSQEVDIAWEKIARVHYFPITEETFLRLGKDPKHAVRVPTSWGLFVAQNDGQHLLHCLNVLRKFSHWEHYYVSSNGTWHLSLLDIAHRSHCLSMLLQHLTCQPSLNTITHVWTDAYHDLFPDFNIQRKCIDHSQILEWQTNVALPDGPFPYPKGDDARISHASPELKLILGPKGRE